MFYLRVLVVERVTLRYFLCIRNVVGLIPLLRTIRVNNDLGHPLCGNLRDGMWLCDYIVARLKRYEGTKEYALVIEKMFSPLKHLQHYLRPCYFEAILSHVYAVTKKQLESKLDPLVY